LAIANVDEWSGESCIMKKLNLNLFIADLMERNKANLISLFAESQTLENEIQKQLNGLENE